MYVTDSLKAIADNTTHFISLGEVVDYGSTLASRWIEIIEQNPEKDPEPEDTRSCAEITEGIFARARITKRQGDKT